MPKFRMTKKLAEKIETIPMIRDHLNAINPEEFGPRDKPLVEYLSKRGERFFPTGHDLRSDWKDFINNIQPVYGLECERNVIAAAILAGAAIARPDIFLRQDLSENIRQQRANYQNQQDSPLSESDLPPGRPPEPITPSGPSTPFAKQLADEYKELIKNINPNGAFDLAIKQLLSTPGKTLPLGWRLRNLDLAELEIAIKEYFGQDKKYDARGIGVIKQGEENRSKLSWANENIKLLLEDFKCKNPQERSDEIFWVVTTRYLKNTEEIFNQIEENINKDEFEIKGFDWEEDIWQSDLFMGIKKGDEKPLNKEILNQRIHKGFCLWSASIMCIEDDDAEYQAIKDTCDDIAKYANYIRQGASITVMATGGVSPVAAGAAIVRVSADIVYVAAKVVSAIVSIVNFFDQNDVLDTKILKNDDDYAQDDENDVKIPYVFKDTLDFKEHSGQAHYELSYKKQSTGITSFERLWRVKTIIDQGNQKERGSWWRFGGGNWDINVRFRFSEEVDQIIDAFVDYNTCNDTPRCKPTCRHAHWKPEWSPNQTSHPALCSDKKTVVGTVHAGTRGTNKVIFTPRAKGIKFLRRL